MLGRRKTNRKLDHSIFRRTANRTRARNISVGHGIQRGGNRF